MNVRMDGIRLLKVFAWQEGVLVGLPLAVYGLTSLVMLLGAVLAPNTLGLLMVLPFLVVRLVGSLYFYLPSLIAPSVIRCASPFPVLHPRGPQGWLVVIAVYSVIALFMAVVPSLYSVDRDTHLA